MHGEVRAYVFNGDLSTDTDLVSFIDSGEARRRCAEFYENTNMVLNVGRQQFTKLIVGETTTGMSYIGLTTSATTPTLALTALTNEIKRNMVTIKSSITTYYQRYVAYFTTSDFASTGIAGAGGFDTASTGGNMYVAASVTFSKTAAQGCVVEWQVLASS